MKINVWSVELNNLRAEHSKISKKISLLEDLIELENEHAFDAPTSNENQSTSHRHENNPRIVANNDGSEPRRRGRPRKNPSDEVAVKSLKLPNLLETIGQQHGKSMRYDDLAILVKSSGYKTNSKDFNNMVYQCLQKLCKKGVFVRNPETQEYHYAGNND
jgi:hypothetical protein